VVAREGEVRTVTADPLKLDPVGGGGTSHACVFEWLDRGGLSPSCVVCLTDLETEFPTRGPAEPVLWAVVGANRSEPPFGRRVTLES
jgi:predicted metal-dependent peptidase